MYDIVEHTDLVQKLLDERTPFAIVTQVAIRGSAPQVVGAKAIVTANGIESGTVGGGKVEAAAIDHAQRLLVSPHAACELVTWNLQTDIGMTCGGEVQLFFEVHTQLAWQIAVYGAGHVSQALIRLLLGLRCHVTCVDTRQGWLDKLPTHRKLTKVCSDAPESTVSTQPAETFFVLMSKGHATDLPVLKEILNHREPPYVGVIGSKQKASVLRRDLKSANVPEDKIASFHCPMGLPIGDNTPSEIAISIAAQLIQCREALPKN